MSHRKDIALEGRIIAFQNLIPKLGNLEVYLGFLAQWHSAFARISFIIWAFWAPTSTAWRTIDRRTRARWLDWAALHTFRFLQVFWCLACSRLASLQVWLYRVSRRVRFSLIAGRSATSELSRTFPILGARAETVRFIIRSWLRFWSYLSFAVVWAWTWVKRGWIIIWIW